ncbi:hypothetical protein Tco_0960264 [Tanacetum coccineum]
MSKTMRIGNGYSEKDKNQSKTNITEHGNGKSVKSQSQSKTANQSEDCPDFEASRARGFVLRTLELQILSFILGIQYPNLID